MPGVVQLCWILIEEPEPTDDVLDISGSRIWYQSTARDLSGATLAGMPERTALKLANATSMEDFQGQHGQSNLNMPLLCHARLSRTARASTACTVGTAEWLLRNVGDTAGASQTTVPVTAEYGQRTFVTIQEIEAVSWDPKSKPNSAYDSVITILKNCPRHDEGLLFAYLSDIMPDPYYGFQVFYDGVESVKAKYVVALVASSSASSTPQNVGNGYKLTTSNINDAANPNDLDSISNIHSYSLLQYATLDWLPARPTKQQSSTFRSDPHFESRSRRISGVQTGDY